MPLMSWWGRLDDERWFVDGRVVRGRALLVRREELVGLAQFPAGLTRTAAARGLRNL